MQAGRPTRIGEVCIGGGLQQHGVDAFFGGGLSCGGGLGGSFAGSCGPPGLHSWSGPPGLLRRRPCRRSWLRLCCPAQFPSAQISACDILAAGPCLEAVMMAQFSRVLRLTACRFFGRRRIPFKLAVAFPCWVLMSWAQTAGSRSEKHTSELQSLR